MENYRSLVNTAYSLSIALGLTGIALVGLKKIDHNNTDNALTIGAFFGLPALLGLCVGYLIETENKK